ncbi:Uncharacterised protein [Mycobacteroides abscessus subsp. abscessus]|nr:Uncharacterised protein [Mycobacteroides abscessus subsp. abscessus]
MNRLDGTTALVAEAVPDRPSLIDAAEKMSDTASVPAPTLIPLCQSISVRAAFTAASARLAPTMKPPANVLIARSAASMAASLSQGGIVMCMTVLSAVGLWITAFGQFRGSFFDGAMDRERYGVGSPCALSSRGADRA